MIRLALAFAFGVAVAISALTWAGVAHAEDGWQLASRSTDTGRWGTFVYVSGYEGTQARLRVRTSRRMRVKIATSIRCHDADYVTSVSRELAPSYRWVSPLRPLGRTYAALFPEASTCSFSVFVTGGRGRLAATLETR